MKKKSATKSKSKVTKALNYEPTKVGILVSFVAATSLLLFAIIALSNS